MKTGRLILAVVITVILLIVVFQNIQTVTQFRMLFSIKSVGMGFPILILIVLGMVAGALYTLAIQSALSEKKEESQGEASDEF